MTISPMSGFLIHTKPRLYKRERLERVWELVGYYDFGGDSGLAGNSGSADDFLLCPKFNAIYSFNESTEKYKKTGY